MSYYIFKEGVNPTRHPNKYMTAYNEKVGKQGEPLKWARLVAKEYKGVVYARDNDGKFKKINQY